MYFTRLRSSQPLCTDSPNMTSTLEHLIYQSFDWFTLTFGKEKYCVQQLPEGYVTVAIPVDQGKHLVNKHRVGFQGQSFGELLLLWSGKPEHKDNVIISEFEIIFMYMYLYTVYAKAPCLRSNLQHKTIIPLLQYLTTNVTHQFCHDSI